MLLLLAYEVGTSGTCLIDDRTDSGFWLLVAGGLAAWIGAILSLPDGEQRNALVGLLAAATLVLLALPLAGAADYLPAASMLVLFVLACALLWGLFGVTRRGVPDRAGRLSLYVGAAVWFPPALWVGLVLTFRCWTFF